MWPDLVLIVPKASWGWIRGGGTRDGQAFTLNRTLAQQLRSRAPGAR